MSEYLSVADFAEAAGVTKQAVYRRLDTNLREYVKVVNEKKYVSTDAIPLFNADQPINNVEQQEVEAVEQPLNNVEPTIDPRDSEISRLLSLLESSQAENRALNERLMTLTLEIAAMGKSAQVIAAQTSGVPLLNNVEQAVEKEKASRLPGWLRWLVNRYEV